MPNRRPRKKMDPKTEKLFMKVMHSHRHFAVGAIIIHVALSFLLSYLLTDKSFAGVMFSGSLFFASLLAFDYYLALKSDVFVTGGPGVAAYPAHKNKKWIAANTVFYLAFIIWMMYAFLFMIGN